MSEFVIPPWIIPDEEDIELIDDNTISFEPALGRGSSQRQSFGAPRYKITRKHTVRTSEEANLASTLTAISGKFISVRSTIKKTLRGSLATSELLGNNQFADGTTGWTVLNNSLHRVSDRVSNLVIGPAQDGFIGRGFGIARSMTAVQYGAYAVRGAFPGAKNCTLAYIALASTAVGADYAFTSGTIPSLVTTSGVVNDTTIYANFAGGTEVGNTYSDYVSCNFTSVARCGIVDNGPNSFLRSAEFSNAAWTPTQATITADSTINYDLSTTADSFTETAVSATHFLGQQVATSTSAFDVAFTFVIKGALRTFAAIQLVHASGTASVFFNLTTGVALSSGSTTGTGFSNTRSFITALGNGWFACSLVVSKSSADATITGRVIPSTNGSTTSYLGDNTTPALYLGEAVLSLGSGFPSRLVRSTTAAVAATGQSGSALYIKGFPVSTNGLALPGDFIEINGELKRLTAPLDSDGLGLGYLQFKPEIIRAPVDNDPVIFFQPFGRFLVSNVRTRQRVSDVELTYELEQVYE